MYINPSLAVGFASEAKVETALKILQKEPEKYGLTSAIARFVRAKKHSELDRRHIDFIVTLEEGTEVPFQVKSSDRRGKKFENFCKRNNLPIQTIVVHIGEAIHSVIGKVVEKIRQAANFLKREAERLIWLNRIRAQKRRRKEQRGYRYLPSPGMAH